MHMHMTIRTVAILTMAPRGGAPLGLFICPQRLERRSAALHQPAALLTAHSRRGARRCRRGTALRLAGRLHAETGETRRTARLVDCRRLAHCASRRLGRQHLGRISEPLCY